MQFSIHFQNVNLMIQRLGSLLSVSLVILATIGSLCCPYWLAICSLCWHRMIWSFAIGWLMTWYDIEPCHWLTDDVVWYWALPLVDWLPFQARHWLIDNRKSDCNASRISPYYCLYFYRYFFVHRASEQLTPLGIIPGVQLRSPWFNIGVISMEFLGSFNWDPMTAVCLTRR